MDYSVRINDHAGGPGPDAMTVPLIPGEESRLEVRVVNLGDPTNLTVRVAGAASSVLRPEKANHYVVLEEMLNILATMPEEAEELQGELVLRTDQGSTRVPLIVIPQHPNAFADPHDLRQPEGDERSPIKGNPSPTETAGGESADPLMGWSEEEKGERDWEDSRRNRSAQSTWEEGANESWGDYRRDMNYPQDSADYHEPSAGFQPPEDFFRPHRSGRMRLTTLIIPIAIIMGIVALLVLTFYTHRIPEYPGALAASMLIVTLIIYGTAMLLKA